MKYPAKRIRRNTDLAWQEVDKVTVVVTPRTKKIHILSGSGSDVFRLLKNPATIEEIISFVCTEYEVAQEQAQLDMEKFIDDLIRAQIVFVEEAS